MRIGKTFPVALTAGALIGMLSGSSGAAELAASSTVTLPGGAAGIGVDDLRFAPSLGVVLVPAGRSGRLDLVDPKTANVTSISGFSEAKALEAGTDQGSHCIAAAPNGAAYVCDPMKGQLLVFRDPLGK